MSVKVFLFMLAGVCIAMVGCQSKTAANLVSDKDNGLHIFTQGRDSINLELLHEDYPQGFDGYLYVLNSECSYCMSAFLKFAKMLENTDYQWEVIVLISEDTQPIVNYYLKEKNLASQVRFILKENKKDLWKIGSNEAENGIVYEISHHQIERKYICLRNEEIVSIMGIPFPPLSAQKSNLSYFLFL